MDAHTPGIYIVHPDRSSTHGTVDAQNKTQKTLCVHEELEYVYSRWSEYLNKDQDILFESVEDHKELPVYSIQNWLIMYKGYLSDSACTAKQLALKEVKNIKHYSLLIEGCWTTIR